MAESLSGMKRSCMVAEVNAELLGQELTLMGWCHRQRDLGNLLFINLRDRSGELQLVCDDDTAEDVFAKARRVRSEYVLACRGILRERSAPNNQMKTGLWELALTELRIISESETPPFYIEENVDAGEALRLKHRYLDLRRPDLQRRIIQRHRIAKLTRDYFDQAGFYEIETPMLIKSTPEGARDYLVPSRIYPGHFFALPQSPQLLKQLLMLAGFDRYMQIARCFRDEDLRADRQPEFTQIDVEMSFVDEEDVQNTIEVYLQQLFSELLDYPVQLPLPRLTWQEAMDRYGSDKPDTRFGMELQDVTEWAKNTSFKVFSDTANNGGVVRLIKVADGQDIKRREIDELTEVVKTYRAKGLAWLVLGNELRGSVAKFLSAEEVAELRELVQAQDNDLLLFVADDLTVVRNALGHLRLAVAEKYNLIPEDTWNFLWITDFPLFEYDEEEKRYVACHHPFTSPKEEDLHLLETDPGAVRARAYDIVLNGYELGGGSIRIHDQELQAKIFELIGFTEEEAKERFGFLLEAFSYGVPPHGGIALGLDRLTMLMTDTNNIRDVIAFPKVQTSSCLLTQAPGTVDEKQLIELGLDIKKTDKKDEEKA